MKALVVINPRAGRGDPLGAGRRAVAHLREAGHDVDCAVTEYARHAIELAAARRDACELLVAVGGDGTVRETLVGLGERAPARSLAVVPMGNANVVARDLGIPLDPGGAIALLTRGTPRAIDVGEVDDEKETRLFLAMVGVGFDALVTRGVDAVRHTKLGGWAYGKGLSDAIYGACALPVVFLRLAPRRFVLESDGLWVASEAPTILVCNTGTYAKGWSMTPEARIDSGRLHWVAAHRAGAPSVLAHLRSAALRRPVGRRLGSYGDGESFRIRSRGPFRWQVDGDPMGEAASLSVRLRPAHARVIAPP